MLKRIDYRLLQWVVLKHLDTSVHFHNEQNAFWGSPRGFGEQGKNYRKEHGDVKLFQGTREQLNVDFDDGGGGDEKTN